MCLTVKEANQLGPLSVGEAPHRLRLTDPAHVQKPCRLHPAELRDRHQHVEHLRGRHVFRRVAEDLLDLDASVLEILLQPGSPDTDVIRPLESFHPLVEGTERRLRLSLEGGHGGGY